MKRNILFLFTILVVVFTHSCVKNVEDTSEKTLCSEGWKLYQSAKYGEAIIYFNKEIAIDKNNCEAYIGVAYSHMRMKEFSESKKTFLIAKEKSPTEKQNTTISIGISFLYMIDKNPHAVVKELSDKINGTDLFRLEYDVSINASHIHLLLCEAYSMLGIYGSEKTSEVNTQDAWGQLKKALEIDASNTYSMELRDYLRRNDSGLFFELFSTAISSHEGTIMLGDLDNDGDLDLVGNKVFINDGNVNFKEAVSLSMLWGDIALGDLNGDSFLDIIIAGSVENKRMVKIYLNNGRAGFSETKNSIIGVRDPTIKLFDADMDGDLDLFLVGYSEHRNITKLYLNQGNAVFVESFKTLFPEYGGATVAIGDLDSDGDSDIVMGNYETLDIYNNNGDGEFIKLKHTKIDPSCSYVVMSDIDNDGDNDLILSNAETYMNKLNIYLNNGSAVFTKVTPDEFAGMRIYYIAVADINSDLNQDLIVYGNGCTKILINEGRLRFVEYALNSLMRTEKIVFGDINGDSFIDMVANGNKIYINKGTNFRK